MKKLLRSFLITATSLGLSPRNRAGALVLALAAITTVANADLISVDGGQLVDDNVANVTWAANASLFKTMVGQSTNTTNFVNTIISDSGGQIVSGNGTYTLTSADFSLTDGTMDWYGAQAWINYLNKTSYLGYSNWRLPTTVNKPGSSTDTPTTTSSELAELVIGELGGQYGTALTDSHNSSYVAFSGFQSNVQVGHNFYWSGTEYTNATAAWSFATWEDSQDFNGKGDFFNVLEVMSGQVPAPNAAAPEPSALLLMGGGFLGLAALAKRRFNR